MCFDDDNDLKNYKGLKKRNFGAVAQLAGCLMNVSKALGLISTLLKQAKPL